MGSRGKMAKQGKGRIGAAPVVHVPEKPESYPSEQTATTAGGALSSEFHSLSADVVNLLHEQAFTTGEGASEAEISRTFSDILLRHWNLCCVITFLRSETGELQQSAVYIHPHINSETAGQLAELMLGKVIETGGECQLWMDEGGTTENGASGPEAKLRRIFAGAELRAGVAVPIIAHGELAGALVVATGEQERLRAALRGIRFVGPAILIAIGNARRNAVSIEQRRRIEQLVEELRQRTTALEGANRELQRIGRYRSLFLARMSHELRTPLTSILGFAEILLDQEDLTATQRRFCEKIQSSGQQLQSSLNQLVDLSRLEAGQTELFLHEFSLRETLRESCAAVFRLAQKQDVTLDCDASPEVGVVLSDEGKLRQVLYNFLAHAISRSPVGGRVEVVAEPADEHYLRVDIKDEGEPLLDPTHLFDPVDIDAPSECSTNMNELGLVIAHRLIGVLGGSVSLHELSPRGLSVRLLLPFRPIS